MGGFFMEKPNFYNTSEENIDSEVLTGGYGNLVVREGSIVRKHFQPNPYTSISPEVRLAREVAALSKFQFFGIAPILFDVESQAIIQEHIKGENLEEKAKRGEVVLHKAGHVLRQIHIPTMQIIDIKNDFEEKAIKLISDTKLLLEREGINIKFSVNWTEVLKRGSTWIHGDFWLANVIAANERIVVIDWEFAKFGSPFEDFAAITLWGTRKYGQEKGLSDAYGDSPPEDC